MREDCGENWKRKKVKWKKKKLGPCPGAYLILSGQGSRHFKVTGPKQARLGRTKHSTVSYKRDFLSSCGKVTSCLLDVRRRRCDPILDLTSPGLGILLLLQRLELPPLPDFHGVQLPASTFSFRAATRSLPQDLTAFATQGPGADQTSACLAALPQAQPHAPATANPHPQPWQPSNTHNEANICVRPSAFCSRQAPRQQALCHGLHLQKWRPQTVQTLGLCPWTS